MKKPIEPELSPTVTQLMMLSDESLPLAEVLRACEGLPIGELFVEVERGWDHTDVVLVHIQVTEQDLEKHAIALATYKAKLAAYDLDQHRRKMVKKFASLVDADPDKARTLLEESE